MSKQSRLKPDAEHRETLKYLHEKVGIIRRRKFGLRQVIEAATGAVRSVGYDLPGLPSYVGAEGLGNFHPAAPKVSAVVTYKGARAELYATQAREGYIGDRLDISCYFPENKLATALLGQPWPKVSNYHGNAPIYGDAFLVTDNRMHWLLSAWKIPAGELIEFNEGLATPRDLIDAGGRHPWIFFHEEPHCKDLLLMKMRFS
jgi:hypothetical protein